MKKKLPPDYAEYVRVITEGGGTPLSFKRWLATVR